jgi:hypothetical protein
MLVRALGRWPLVLGLVTSACALAGYDFGDYERDSTTATAYAPAPGTAGSAGAGDTDSTEPVDPPQSIDLVAPFASAYGAGGDHDPGATPSEAAGAAGAAGREASEEAVPCPACKPRGCLELTGQRCGVTGDGCGATLDCGTCFWSFQECRQSLCHFPE